jgi:hypothetical protein
MAEKAAKRELIDTGSDKRYVRRGSGGHFKESDDVSKSLSADRRTKASQREERSGRQGRTARRSDRGDVERGGPPDGWGRGDLPS